MNDTLPTLHVVTASQRRGAEVFASDLVGALADQGHPGRLAALTAGPDGGDQLGAQVLGPAPFHPGTLRALRSAARSSRAVVAHGSKTLPATALALAGSRTPFVYRSIGDPQAWSGSGLRRVRTAALLQRAARVVALWPGAADVLGRVHGVPAAKLAVIPNGVPSDRFPPADQATRDAARLELDLPAGEPLVLYLGALSPEKQVGHALEAVAALPGVHVAVVGAGPDRAVLEGTAASLGLGGRAHFTGPVEKPQAALAAADVVVLPSRTEGMPGVLLEAGFTGRPAVATDVGGVAEIVRPGETGVLVAPGDVPALAEGLRTALADATALGAAARRHCLTHFDMPVVAARWAEVLGTL
ncbi:MAG TPA: glycosyltransferase family 4 protein [Acidimicrobiales bacterium]